MEVAIVEIVTRPHAENLVSWAKDKPEVVVLNADLAGPCEIEPFCRSYPDRFFSMGIAEQNMMGFAAGFAREGLFPFVHTFGVFITRRSFDQIAMSIAYPNLPVRLLGFLPGLMTPLGVSHQAIEDIALMRALPNMTVLECGDATEVESVLDVAQSISGPVYVRMLRGKVPRLFDRAEPMQLGQPRIIQAGNDVTIISSGVCAKEVLEATSRLKNQGISIRHLHISTLKPFENPMILDAVSSARYGVISVENHSVIGGVGSALAEMMAEAGLGKRLIRLGLKDTFAHSGSWAYLSKKFGLDETAICQAVETLIENRISPSV